MENSVFRKGLVIAIIVCFVGVSVFPSISGDIERTSLKTIFEEIIDEKFNSGSDLDSISGLDVYNPNEKLAILFEDDFNDNTKDYSKWSGGGDGEWYERNERTELSLQGTTHIVGHGIESVSIPVTITSTDYVQINVDAISDIPCESHVGSEHIVVSDEYNNYLEVRLFRENELVVTASDDSYEYSYQGPDILDDCFWDCEIKIYSDRFRVIAGACHYDYGWVSSSLFSSSSQLHINLGMILPSASADTALSGFDNVVVQDGSSGNNPPDDPSTPSGPSSGTVGVSYTFSTSTTDSDGDDVKYGWDWDGDNSVDEWTGFVSSGTTVNTDHMFGTPGTYNVKVKAEDSNGAQSDFSPSLSITISGINNPPDDPSTPSGPSSGTVGVSYTFSTSTTDSDGDDVQYRFDWNANAGHEYSSWTSLGASGHTDSLSYSWGSAGTYVVKAQARDERGATSEHWSDGLTVTVIGNQLPTCTLSADPDSGFAPLDVVFTMKANDPDGTIYRWVLDYDDGTSDTDSGEPPTNIQHTYDNPGNYEPLLAVQDNYADWGHDRVTITVTDGDPPNTPTIPNGPSTCQTKEIVTFSTSATDDNGDQVQYRFDWDDGQVSSWTSLVNSGQSNSKTHTWSNPGTYYVKAQAKDEHGAESEWSDGSRITVSAYIPPEAVIESINPNPAGVKKPDGLRTREDPVTFVAKTHPTIIKYIWKIDGNIVYEGSSNEFSTSDVSVGKHSVSLIVEFFGVGLSEEVFFEEDLEIIDGYVFRPPYDSSEWELNSGAIVTDPSGDGEDYPQAGLNTDRGDLYVYSIADGGLSFKVDGEAGAAQYVLFDVEPDTDEIEVIPRIHSCGGKMDVFSGKSSIMSHVHHYYKWLDTEWYGRHVTGEFIRHFMSPLDMLNAMYIPFGLILGTTISSVVQFITAMSSATLDVLSYNKMLDEIKNVDNYKVTDYSVIVDISYCNKNRQAIAVNLRAETTSSILGITKAFEMGLLEHIIIKKHTPDPPDSCFPAGTKITMADGSIKKIEDVKIGDEILSYDFKTNDFSSWKVKVIETPFSKVNIINNGLIEFSNGHPFHVMKSNGNLGWATLIPLQDTYRIKSEIYKLEVGDKIYTINNDWINITDINQTKSSVQMYNLLSYYGANNYYANDILVHEDYATIAHYIRDAIESGNPIIYLLNLIRNSNLITNFPLINLLLRQLIYNYSI